MRGSYSGSHDLALLEVGADIVFSKNIQPICLPYTVNAVLATINHT